MKLTKQQLKQIIKEELSAVLERRGGVSDEDKKWIRQDKSFGFSYSLYKINLDEVDPQDERLQLALTDILKAAKDGHLNWWSDLRGTDAQRFYGMIKNPRQIGKGMMDKLKMYLNLLLDDMDEAAGYGS